MKQELSTFGPDNDSFALLRLVAEHLKALEYPSLVRPRVLPREPPTKELIDWGIQAYSFPWIRHFAALISGIVVLTDMDNKAAVRIVGRSSYELCAHIYYVKKHLTQHLDKNDLQAAWDFLLPLASGSRYINEIHPEESSLFPAPAHISKAVNCFMEIMPKDSNEDYSYLSEYCHPNMMAFMQHCRWATPEKIEFVDTVVFGAFGAIAASSIQGLLTLAKLLALGNEKEIRASINRLLRTIAEQSTRT